MDEKINAASPQHGCFLCTTAIPLLERCWTEATRDHFRNSRIEFLKGLRSLIDGRIGMEGAGPMQGDPIASNVVVATPSAMATCDRLA